VVLAIIAGRTASIRLGSAGVVLPHHQPLVVAEQFATLSTVAPAGSSGGPSPSYPRKGTSSGEQSRTTYDWPDRRPTISRL
jgi:Luciferase-like monooxygenase